MSTTTTVTQDEVLAKLYRDLTRLAGEIAVDRCRTRVLLRLVKEKTGVTDAELDQLFREEVETNLEGFVHGITQPMVEELQGPEAGGCCGGHGHAH